MELLDAVRQRSVRAVRETLYRDGSLAKREGRQALYASAEMGDMQITRFLIEYSAVNLRERDGTGRSVLHAAVRSGNLALTVYLVEQCGCSPTDGDMDGVTPFDLAHGLGMAQIEAYFECECGAKWKEMFHNPVMRGFSPDPSIIAVGDDFYMVNSSFCYFPCIPVSHSRDLIHWRTIGHAVTDEADGRLAGLESGRGYWAPDISYWDGRFYITATYRRNDIEGIRRIQMVTSSKRPEGPYDSPSFIDEDGIDPSIFHDSDGRKYMLLNRGARIFELSRDCRRKISEPRMLWYGDWKVTPEGPHLLKYNGYYYLFMAEGGTESGHRITVARSKERMGRYEPCPYNPVLRQEDEGALLQCCGHGKPVRTSDGRWYMAYLCRRTRDGVHGIMGRETALDPMEWTLDGWPVVNRGRGPSSQQIKPFKDEGDTGCIPAEPVDGTVSFEDMGWVTPRGRCESRMEPDQGAVVIYGKGKDLNSPACQSLLLQRQKEAVFAATCTLCRPDIEDGGDAGMTCYYDESSYVKFGIGMEGESYGFLLAEYVDNGYRSRRFVPVGRECPDRACLGVQAADMKRSFYYRLPGGTWKLAGILEDTGYLSSEGLGKGKRFTGAMTGIYVNGMAARFQRFTAAASFLNLEEWD